MPQSLPGHVSEHQQCLSTNIIHLYSFIYLIRNILPFLQLASSLTWPGAATQNKNSSIHCLFTDGNLKEVILCKDKNSVHHVMTPDAIK